MQPPHPLQPSARDHGEANANSRTAGQLDMQQSQDTPKPKTRLARSRKICAQILKLWQETNDYCVKSSLIPAPEPTPEDFEFRGIFNPVATRYLRFIRQQRESEDSTRGEVESFRLLMFTLLVIPVVHGRPEAPASIRQPMLKVLNINERQLVPVSRLCISLLQQTREISWSTYLLLRLFKEAKLNSLTDLGNVWNSEFARLMQEIRTRRPSDSAEGLLPPLSELLDSMREHRCNSLLSRNNTIDLRVPFKRCRSKLGARDKGFRSWKAASATKVPTHEICQEVLHPRTAFSEEYAFSADADALSLEFDLCDSVYMMRNDFTGMAPEFCNYDPNIIYELSGAAYWSPPEIPAPPMSTLKLW